MEIQRYKALDMMRVSAYVHGRRDEVPVEDIRKHSGAEVLRIFPILFELEQAELIEVVRRDIFGAPLSVRSLRKI
jgi:hypothetical protein